MLKGKKHKKPINDYFCNNFIKKHPVTGYFLIKKFNKKYFKKYQKFYKKIKIFTGKILDFFKCIIITKKIV